MSLSAAGVLFVEDFDEPPPQPAQEHPEIIAPHYTAHDLETAREEGRAAGAEEARADHAAVQAALCNAALAAIGDALATARTDVARMAESRAQDIAAAMLALLGAALPATAARLASQEVGALLATLLAPLGQTPCVRVRVHPDVLDAVAAQLAAHGDVTASADATLAPSDVCVTWQDGHARRDWSAVWAQITLALARFELPVAPDHQTGG